MAKRDFRAGALGLALLGASACPQAKVEPKPEPQVVAGLEVRVDAPGMSAEHVEQWIVQPIELALVGNSDIREMIAEAHEGRARIRLGLSDRAERVAVDVLERVQAIQSQLPEDVNPPELRLRDLHATTLHFALADADGEAAQTLLRAIEATAGVREVGRCGAAREVVIEIDPTAMRRLGVALSEVERAARSAMLMQHAITLEELSKISVVQADGVSITLRDLATVRVALDAQGCKAYTEQGAALGVSVTLAHDEARKNVEAQLEAARDRGLVLQRFDSRLHVWIDAEPEPTLARVRELSSRHAAAEIAGAGWMLEVGVDANPCEGPGTLARLHLSAGATFDSLIDALATTPGVALVEHPDNPRIRKWLLGPDAEVLGQLGGDAAASAESVVLLDAEPRPQTVVDVDREKLAERGLDPQAVSLMIAAALDGVEIGHIPRVGPVMLRFEGEPTQVGDLSLALTNGESVALSSVAQLRDEQAPTRVCRRNGERGVVLLVRPQDAALRFGIELPPGYRWGDG